GYHCRRVPLVPYVMADEYLQRDVRQTLVILSAARRLYSEDHFEDGSTLRQRNHPSRHLYSHAKFGNRSRELEYRRSASCRCRVDRHGSHLPSSRPTRDYDSCPASARP